MAGFCDAIPSWDQLSRDERLYYLAEASRSFLNDFGLDDGTLQYDSYVANDPAFAANRTDYGYYDSNTQTVYFNESKWEKYSANPSYDPAKEAYDTAIHESMHYIDHLAGYETGDILSPEDSSMGYYDPDTDELSFLEPGERLMGEVHQEIDTISEEETNEMMQDCGLVKTDDAGGEAYSVDENKFDFTLEDLENFSPPTEGEPPTAPEMNLTEEEINSIYQ